MSYIPIEYKLSPVPLIIGGCLVFVELIVATVVLMLCFI